MNEIVNRFLSTGDKLLPEMHLQQPGYTYSACGPITKNKKTIWKFKETRYSYFQHEMAYGGFIDLTGRTPPHKIWHDKAYWVSKGVLLQFFINFWIK